MKLQVTKNSIVERLKVSASCHDEDYRGRTTGRGASLFGAVRKQKTEIDQKVNFFLVLAALKSADSDILTPEEALYFLYDYFKTHSAEYDRAFADSLYRGFIELLAIAYTPPPLVPASVYQVGVLMMQREEALNHCVETYFSDLSDTIQRDKSTLRRSARILFQGYQQQQGIFARLCPEVLKKIAADTASGEMSEKRATYLADRYFSKP